MIKLLSKFFHMMMGDAGMKLLNFAVIFYLAKIGQAEALGWIITGSSFLRWMDSGSRLGWNTLGIMEGSNTTDNQQAAIYWAKVIWSIPVLTGMSLLAYVTSSEPIIQSICLLYVLNGIVEIFNPVWFFISQQKFKLISLTRLFSHILYALFIVLQVRTSDDFISIPLWYLLAQLPSLLIFMVVAAAKGFGAYNFATSHALFHSNWRLRFASLLEKSLHLGASQIFLGTPITLPPFLLGLFAAQGVGSFAFTGQFGLALRLLMALMIFDQIVHMMILSSLKVRVSESQSFFKLAVIISIIGGALAWTIQFIPWVHLLSVLGQDFVQSDPLFKTLSFTLGLTIFHSFIQSWLFHSQDSKTVMKYSIQASLIPIAALAITALGAPDKLATMVVVAECFLISFLMHKIYKKQFIYFLSWFLILGLLPLYLIHKWGNNPLYLFYSVIVWLLICYFHPMMTPWSEIPQLLKRWQKLNK